MSKRFLVVILFLSSLLGMAFSSPKAYSEENKEERALFILNSTERDAVREAILQIRSQGGRISITSPPALLGYIPKDKADELVGEFGIIGIYFDEIDIASIEKHGEAVVSEVRIWNRMLAKEKQERIQGVIYEEGRGLPPKNDILVDTTDYPIPDYILKRMQLQGQTLRPWYYFTSEYMVGGLNKPWGNISVIVVYVESNGARGCHQSTYDWTDDEKKDVNTQVRQALDWWSRVATDNGVTLTFYPKFYTAESCYEPITMPLGNLTLWVPGVIDYLRRKEVDFNFCHGIADAPDNHYDKTLAACNCIRDKYKTDWVFTVFMVNNHPDPTPLGLFSDLRSAAAYVGGPSLFIAYSNNRDYQLTQIQTVLAHEIGHIFYALDEYYGGPPASARSGYLNVENGNAEALRGDPSHQLSIMGANCINAFQQDAISDFAKGQIGWWDKDGDGFPDVTRPPDTSLNENYSLIYTRNPRYTGSTWITAASNNNPYDCTMVLGCNTRKAIRQNIAVNSIDGVDGRIDDKYWFIVKSVDTYSHPESLDFTFNPNTLLPGAHTIEVRGAARGSDERIIKDPTPAVDEFTIALPPERPTLASPANGSTVEILKPKLDWSDVSGATSYKIQVATSTAFASPVINTTVTRSEYTPTSNLSFCITYYWRVCATNQFGDSSWTPAWSFTPRSYVYGGNNQKYYEFEKRGWGWKETWLELSDKSYKMYEFKKNVHKERGIRFPKDETYIDHGENKLRIKVKLYGWVLGKARYHVTYYVYGRKEAPCPQSLPLTAELFDTLEAGDSDTEDMPPDVTPTISLKLPGDSEERNKISVMLKDIYAPLDTAKMTLSFDPEKVSIKDVEAPILRDPELRVVISKKEIDRTRGIVEIEAIVEDLDPNEIKIVEGNELLDDDYVDDNEVDTECVAPILHVILDPAAGSEASSIALAQNSLRIQSVELKDVDGEIIKVELPQITCAHSFSPGWNLMSIPVDPVDPSVEAVIEDDVNGYYALFGYNGSNYTQSETLERGPGYWLYLEDEATVDVEGTEVANDFTASLAQGWTLIGTPANGEIDFTTARVTRNGAELSLWEAAVKGWVYPYLYRYNGTEYKLATTMAPWSGYWFYAFEPGCELTIPVAPEGSAPSASPALLAGAAARLEKLTPPAIPGLAQTGSILPAMPARTKLNQNYPNPLNPETFIPYLLAADARVVVRIYNLAGELVRTIDLGEKTAGVYTAEDKAAHWDGRNETGEEVSSGVYFYQLQVGRDVMTRKMIVLK